MKYNFTVALLIIQFVFLTWIFGTPTDHQYFAYAQSLQPPQQPPQQPQNTAPLMVAAGGGNGTGPLTLFLPSNIEIKTGQSVTWYNPTKVAEPHTVSFIFDNTTFADVVSPLAVSNTTKFQPLPPGSNNAPILLPNKYGTNVIIAINARTFNPTVIDSADNVKSMNPNANHTMIGTEKYVNSGWFLPKGLEQAYPGSGNTFTVKFEKPGTYNYICILHPWMTGSVTVR
jgi:plastocyanin